MYLIWKFSTADREHHRHTGRVVGVILRDAADMAMNLVVRRRRQRPPQCGRRLTDVIADRAREVCLVGEAE